ncbi:hypothetical protein TM48_03415 [Mycobacterium shottsii]|uniref:Uncharacterized protein n=1 Tax=Mycobacterium shottsii TaxID=133549 RepID=A0A7I7LIF7_9MYCO|nr:hypothetical protein TM48_03415 [Mycobacterium shottsii]BBX59169.1 hypothetical protein MSHO_45140 [Mycobacterium shottsii]
MAAPRLRSLPRNVTDVTRALVCVDGTVQNLQLSPDVGSVPLERATPIREFFSWPGKRNYEGLYWSSTNRSHVWPDPVNWSAANESHSSVGTGGSIAGRR